MKKTIFLLLLIILSLILFPSCIMTSYMLEAAQDDEVVTLPENSDFTPSDNWKICQIVDNYGRATGEKYLRYKFTGVFQNTATRGSEITGYMYVYKNGAVKFNIYEYGKYLATGYGLGKGASNDAYYLTFGDYTAEMTLYGDGDFHFHRMNYTSWIANPIRYREVIDILCTGETISVRLSGGKYTTSTYYFTIDSCGFANSFVTAFGE